MPANPRPEYPTAQAAGISEYNVIEYGNINLNLRPIVKLKDGSIATIFSITITEGTTAANRVHALIPTISDDGVKITDKEARIPSFFTYKIVGIIFLLLFNPRTFLLRQKFCIFICTF